MPLLPILGLTRAEAWGRQQAWIANGNFDAPLDWARLNLTSLPDTLPQALTTLDIDNNRLASLPDTLPQALTELNASYNRLTSLPDTLPQALTTLSVGGNELTSLPDTLPQALTTLGVGYNRLTSLPDILPQALTTLEVGGNRLTSLPDTLPQALTTLDVGRNELTSLPDTLPHALTTLDVDNNRLTSLPDTLPQALTTLDVGRNELTSLPDTLPHALTTLDVDNNRLTSLPDTLPQALTTLGVGDNELTSLPDTLPQALTELNVHRNRLTSLPDTLPQALTTLGVGDNELTSLPDTLPQALTELNVHRNRLTSLPDTLPQALTTLDVSRNRLTSLPDTLPQALTTLDVSRNRLTSLPDTLPQALTTLDVSRNRLTSLPNTIIRLSSNCIVNLQNNPLPEQVRTNLETTMNAVGYSGPQIFFSMASQGDRNHRGLGTEAAEWLGANDRAAADLWRGFAVEPGAAEFSRLLARLRQTVNASNLAFKASIQDWLEQLATRPALRALSFSVAVGSTETCEDRVSLTYNAMRTARLVDDVEGGAYDDRPDELVPLARGMFRLQALDQIAREKVSTLRFVDEIEVYLAYQVKLRGRLELPLDVVDMRFFGVSYVNDADLAAAETRVREQESQNFAAYLSTKWGPWEAVVKRIAPKESETVQKELTEAMAEPFNQRLADRLKDLNLSEGRPGYDDASRELGAIVRKEIEVEIKGRLTKKVLSTIVLSDASLNSLFEGLPTSASRGL